jgi:long-chain fatty acid transport protein
MKPFAFIVSSWLSLLGAAASAAAGGFAVGDQSVSAGGTGGAGAARSEDPGAAWYNPAALADGAGLRVGVGLIAAMSSLHAEAMDGSWSEDSQQGASPLPSLHASFADGNLVGGISIGVPFGASVAWPDGWAGRHEIIASRLMIIRAAPFVGWRHGRWRVAGGLHLDTGELRIQRSLDFVDAEGDVDLSLRGMGVGAHVAGWARVQEDDRGALDVGLTYKSRTHLDLSGEADFTSPDAFSVKTADQNASSAITLPDRLTAGAAWRRGPWTLLADVELAAWQVHEQIAIDFEQDQTPDVVQPADWHATVTVRAGAEWRGGAWTARGGVYRDPAPSSASTMSPSSPDSDRLGGSLGLGRQMTDALALDAFYGFMALAGRESTNPDSMDARYGGHAHLVGLGLRYAR